MPRFAANLNWMFTEWPLADRFAAAADAGFAAIEMLDPYELPPDLLAAKLARHRLTPALFNMAFGDSNADIGPPARQRRGLCRDVEIALLKTDGDGNAHEPIIQAGCLALVSRRSWVERMRSPSRRRWPCPA